MNNSAWHNLVACIKELHSLGHSPATSTNFSCRGDNGNLWISRSGVDKSCIQVSDFLAVDALGAPLEEYKHLQPSAETAIHCTIYNLFPETAYILHSHHIWPLVLAHKKQLIEFEGYELQKAFPKVTTHQGSIQFPVLPNSQNMDDFVHEITSRKAELKWHIFMIEKHGFYAWAPTLFEAKRLTEAFTYLCHAQWLLTS